jgi:hypothetical protein
MFGNKNKLQIIVITAHFSHKQRAHERRERKNSLELALTGFSEESGEGASELGIMYTFLLITIHKSYRHRRIKSTRRERENGQSMAVKTERQRTRSAAPKASQKIHINYRCMLLLLFMLPPSLINYISRIVYILFFSRALHSPGWFSFVRSRWLKRAKKQTKQRGKFF